MNLIKILMINFNKFIRLIRNGSYMMYSKVKMFRVNILFFFRQFNFFKYGFKQENSFNKNEKEEMLNVFNEDFIEKQVREILSLIKKEEELKKCELRQKRNVVRETVKDNVNEKLNKLFNYKLNKYKSVIEICERINKQNDKEKKNKFNDCLMSILQLENRETMKTVFSELLEKNKRKNSIEISYTPSPEPIDFEIISMENVD